MNGSPSNLVSSSDSGLAAEKQHVAVRAAQQADALAIDPDMLSHGKPNPDLLQLHQMMRGRYRLAITLMLIGAIAGTAIGFKSGKKVYASKGMIEVKASLPKVLYNVDEKGTLPNFDSYVETQAAWLRNQDVINQAMVDEQWQKVRPGTSDLAIEEFSKELTITHEGQIINVQVVDPDPLAAQTAVQTLISAYEKLYTKQDAKSEETRILAIEDRLATSNKALAFKRQRIREIADSYGTDHLDSIFQFKQQQLNKIEESIQEKNMLLSAAEKGAASTTQPSEPPPTIDELEMLNPRLAQLRQQDESYDQQIATYEAASLGQQNQSMLAVQRLKARNKQVIDELVTRLQKQRASGHRTVMAGGTLMSAAELNAKLKELTDQQKRADEDRLKTGRDMLEIEQLRGEAKDLQDVRDEAQHGLDHLQVEETLNTRIVVLDRGDKPRSVYRNTQIPFAAAGGCGGGMLGFGFVAAMALMDRRLRSPQQADSGRFKAPILGMLPRLPENLLDPIHASMAAHCVHEIRTLLQISSRQSMHRAFAITSPHAGAGKTSLTLALGASYAASNLRTLIVDCDLVAGGLSRRLEAAIPRDFGDILVRERLVTDKQMIHIAKLVGTDAQAQGGMLVTWNVISAEQMDRALEMMPEEPVGILDAMHGAPVSRCIMETGISNLQVMPVGSATARDVSVLSPEALYRLIESLRHAFDVVLVDTGPILGSLEASLLAGVVDGVVLTVAKGDRRGMVERAMSQLATVGARVAGIVFNGASIEELIAYGSGSSARGSTSSDRFIPASEVETLVPSRYGPLTCAVTTSSPSLRRSFSPGQN